jgi:hypothetical protein
MESLAFLNTIVGLELVDSKVKRISSKKTKSLELEQDKIEELLRLLEHQMVVNVRKLFPDFEYKPDSYRKTIHQLVESNQIVVVADRPNELVITKKPADDLF